MRDRYAVLDTDGELFHLTSSIKKAFRVRRREEMNRLSCQVCGTAAEPGQKNRDNCPRHDSAIVHCDGMLANEEGRWSILDTNTDKQVHHSPTESRSMTETDLGGVKLFVPERIAKGKGILEA